MAEKRIKIAYFIDRLIRGGSELQLIEQINLLHRKGVEQELFCLYKSQEHEKVNISCKTNILGIRKLISGKCLSALFWLVGYLRKRNFNIVQTYFFDSTMIGVLAGKIAGKIRIISCRRDLGFWYTPTLILFLRMLNRITDRILVNSNAVKLSVIKKERANPGDIDIISNGIDIAKFNYSKEQKKNNRSEFGIKSSEICVGMITNMSRKVKRVDIFIKAARYILEKKKDVKFIILGDGKLKDQLLGMTRELGLEEQIMFPGREVSKHNALSAMDIGVLSSDSEGFSNAIMEYMAAGLPVVATAVGGNVDLVKKNETGFLTRPGNFKELSDKILELANDRKKCLKCGENGKSYIARFDWGKTTDKLLNYYTEQIKA